MRSAIVLYKNQEAGVITQHDDGSFSFRYHDAWVEAGKPPVSLTLPVTKAVYEADILFPFFFHLLPEGVNRADVCQQLRIDEDDDFGLLLSLGHQDTIGAVNVVKPALQP